MQLPIPSNLIYCKHFGQGCTYLEAIFVPPITLSSWPPSFLCPLLFPTKMVNWHFSSHLWLEIHLLGTLQDPPSILQFRKTPTRSELLDTSLSFSAFCTICEGPRRGEKASQTDESHSPQYRCYRVLSNKLRDLPEQTDVLGHKGAVTWVPS